MMGDLRLSVIDQCNLRCRYCMPEEHYTWLPRQDLLSVKEISAIVDVFLSVGVSKVRITGGEPLIRPDLPEIVRTLSAKVGEDSGLRDLAITTNGVLLADRVDGLKAAGMKRITVSLDTLQPERFKAISQRNSHDKVIAGIKAVAAAGFTDTKIDTTVMRGANHDELADLIEFARTVNAEVRLVASIANDINHHPDIAVLDKRSVRVTAWTRKLGYLTDIDFDLAASVEAMYATEFADRPAR